MDNTVALGTVVFDHIINLRMKYLDRSVSATEASKELYIECPLHGKKPLIRIDYNRVPENVCYECSIQVNNFNLAINSFDITEIEVELGYVNNTGINTCKLLCSVFASYTPDPGPDGYTIFNCLIADASAQIFNGGATLSIFNSKTNKWTVEDVFKRFEEKTGLKVHRHLSQNVLNAQYTKKSIPGKVFGSLNALIDEVRATVEDIAKALNQSQAVTSILFNKDVYFVELDKNGNIAPENKTITALVYELNVVENADWNAGVLTVTAPFNPQVVPGSLFKITPRYYQGGKGFPNEVMRSGERNAQFDTYFVLTQKVSFDTVSTTSMTLMAVPFQDSPFTVSSNTSYSTTLDAAKKKQQEQEEFYEEAARTQAKAAVTYLVDLGSSDEAVDEVLTAADELNNFTFNLKDDVPYVIVSGDTLSEILSGEPKNEQYPNVKNMKNLPPLRNKASNIVAKAYTAWLPIIAISTNTHYKADTRNRSVFKIDLANPDNISVGNWLILPSPSYTWASIKEYWGQIAKFYDAYARFYATTGKSPEWARSLASAAEVLKNREVFKDGNYAE